MKIQKTKSAVAGNPMDELSMLRTRDHVTKRWMAAASRTITAAQEASTVMAEVEQWFEFMMPDGSACTETNEMISRLKESRRVMDEVVKSGQLRVISPRRVKA